MKIKQLYPNIFIVTENKTQELCKIFIRLQEHYESPYFRGKFFSLNEYKKWYINNSKDDVKTKKFTYYDDWQGFNIPSYILEPFYEGKFGKLSARETKLLDYFKKYRGQKFYIIGSQPANERVLQHEIAHALWYVNDEYNKLANEIISKIDLNLKNKFKKELLDMGYCENVIDDEMHAYTIDRERTAKQTEFKDTSKLLKENFNKHLTNIIF